MNRIDIVLALETALLAFCYMIILACIYPSPLLISAIVVEVVAFVVVFACRIFASRTKKAQAEAAVIGELIRQNKKLNFLRTLLEKGKLCLVALILVLVPLDLMAFTAAYFRKDSIAQFVYTYIPTSSLLCFDPAYSLELMAGAYIEAGHHARAKELCGLMFQIRKQIYGESHEMVASILADIADLYRKEHNFSTAGIYYLRALQISEVVLKDEKMGSLLTRIGNNLREQGRYREAVPYYERAIEMRINDFGEMSSNVAESRFEFSVLLDKMGQTAQSTRLKELSAQTWRNYRASKEPITNVVFIICMFALSCVGSVYLVGPRGYLTTLAVKQLRASIEASIQPDMDDLERLRALYRYQRKENELSEFLLALNKNCSAVNLDTSLSSARNEDANMGFRSAPQSTPGDTSAGMQSEMKDNSSNNINSLLILGLSLNHICSAMDAELLA